MEDATSTTRNRIFPAGIVAAMLVAVAALIVLQRFGETTEASDIVLELPEGYQGVIRIREDHGGVEVNQTDGRYVYTVPSSGELVARTTAPLQWFESIYATYPSGQRIEGVSLGTELIQDPEQIRIAMLAADGKGWFYLGVGTAEQLVDIRDDPNLLFQHAMK